MVSRLQQDQLHDDSKLAPLHIRILDEELELASKRVSCEGMLFAFGNIPRISLTCKLAPVRYREYKCGLLPICKTNRALIIVIFTHSTPKTVMTILGGIITKL